MSKELLSLFKSASFWQTPGVRFFITNYETTAFFWACVRGNKQWHHQDIKNYTMPGDKRELALFKAELEQSFLGQQQVYWLIPSPIAHIKIKKETYDILKTYQGPHTVICTISEADSGYFSGITCYDVPGTIRGAALATLIPFLPLHYAEKKLSYVHSIFATKIFTLNDSCMILFHLEYMPIQDTHTVHTYLQRLLQHDGSLFHLADLFFKHQWSLFFPRWEQLYPLYSDMFWLSFWSDQVWRAYYVHVFLAQKNMQEARKISYRLPHSYIGGVWRRNNTIMLYDFYRKLYFFDTRVKKGSYFSMQDAILTTSLVAGV